MHGGPVVLSGPVWWVAVAFLRVALLLAAFVVFDSLRAARAERLAAVPESRFIYLLPSAAFIVLALVAQFAGIPLLGVASVATAPFVIALAMAYLLRVVFPGTSPVENEGSGGDAIEDAGGAEDERHDPNGLGGPQA